MSRPRGSPSNRGRGARARGRKAAVLPSRMKIETSSTQRFTICQTVAGPDKSITSTSTVLLDNARPAKRQKIDEMESDGSNHPDGDGKEPTAEKSGKKGQQAMSVKLKDFVTNLDRIIDKLIAKEAHLDIGEPCHCEHSKAFEIGDGIPGERLKNPILFTGPKCGTVHSLFVSPRAHSGEWCISVTAEEDAPALPLIRRPSNSPS
ncbi:hypothetical protein SCHPADRAFT_948025 [Schizopora paradoxa]|uniref:Uncharacterized protein n=1 Tax=Schizopora paradoxa TaxID=27342 RepID=A0A0H2QXH3_9AGAM|nr:hypothetical protein SCHPADRAFT_948025 [Schizopora paradoxa]